MENIKSFTEYLNEEISKEKPVAVKPEKPVLTKETPEVKKVEVTPPVTSELLSKAQNKKLPDSLKTAIIKNKTKQMKKLQKQEVKDVKVVKETLEFPKFSSLK